MKKLKKFLITGATVALLSSTLVGCEMSNMTIFDTTYSFERVMLRLPDGEVIEGECTSWADYENSDMIQVTINGKTYLTHITNVVLISE